MNQDEYDAFMDVIGAAVRLMVTRQHERITQELHDGGNSIIRDHQRRIAELGAENARLRQGLRTILHWYAQLKVDTRSGEMSADEIDQWRTRVIEDAGLSPADMRVLQ